MNTEPATCPNCGKPVRAHALMALCPDCLLKAGAATGDGATEPPGASSFAPPSPEELARLFPQFEILRLIGRGGMGIVYEVRQKSLNRVAALKLLTPERVGEHGFAERFRKEAHALAALNHPHIVTVYDFGETGGFYYLLMEYVEGVNLRQAMQTGRFTPEQALAVVPPVCEALQFAHEHGIVHRDIKPENLLLDKAGRIKIADFGIAKIVGGEPGAGSVDEEGALASAAGTPHYMAPEQKEHRAVDHRVDIYSLGVVLYELLTGELPANRLQPPSSRGRGLHIDVRLDEIVLRALEARPERRYQTAAEFRTQLETVAATPAAPSGSLLKKRLRKFFLVTLPAALAIALLVRIFILQPFVAATDAAAPEIPRGSRVLVWKLWREASPGDLIAYRHENAVSLGRVARHEGSVVSVERNGGARLDVPEREVLGRVVSVYWRAAMGSSGPAHEQVVTGGIDLETGALVELPLPQPLAESDPVRYTWYNEDPKVESWAREHSVDLFDLGNHGLVGVDLQLAKLEESEWETLTREGLESKIQSMQELHASRFTNFPGDGVFGLKTRHGSLAVLEVLQPFPALGVKIRYKLLAGRTPAQVPAVPTPSDRAQDELAGNVNDAAKSGPPNVPREDHPIPESLLAEPPKLRFLAWQEEWTRHQPKQPGVAFHPDGTTVTDAAELRVLEFVQPTRCDASQVMPDKRNPPFLHLWLSHPLLDDRSYNEVSLLDAARHPLALGAAGSLGSNVLAADPERDGLGWLTYTLSPGGAPGPVIVQLRYSLGPWQEQRKFQPDEQGTIALGQGSQFNAVGQDAKGHAFFSISIDMQQDGSRQFGVVAVTPAGKEFTPSSVGGGGGVGEAVHVKKFVFAVGLSEIAYFRLVTRPIKTAEFTGVLLHRTTLGER